MEEFNSISRSMGAGEVKHNADGMHVSTSGVRPSGGISSSGLGTSVMPSGNSGTWRNRNGYGWGSYGYGYPIGGLYWGDDDDNDTVVFDKNGRPLKKTVIYSADGTTPVSTSAGFKLNRKQKYAIQGACIGAALGLVVAGFMKKPLGKYAGVGAVIGAIGYYLLTSNTTPVASSAASPAITATVSNMQDTITVPNNIVTPT